MRSLTPLALLLLAVAVPAAEPLPFDSPRWTITAAESRVEEHLSRPSLLLRGGLAVIEDADFTDGVIEFEVAFSGERGFAGAVWRVQDRGNYEEFYIRPHQSGNPDANQYTPVFNGLPGWQLYHGEGYGAPVGYPVDRWIPVRIVISGGQGEVFIGDLEKPALFIDELKRPVAAGGVGLSAANYAPAHFTGFRYKKVERPALVGRLERTRDARPGTVMEWAVSSPVDEATLRGGVLLPTSGDELKWETLRCESTGLANLARVHGIARGADAVLARVKATVSESTTRVLVFGYSDRVRVYLNGRLLYAGDNGYRTRDYRYLGTIGYFDSVALPLAKGENDLTFAVSESFGGWGLQAAFADPAGIELATE